MGCPTCREELPGRHEIFYIEGGIETYDEPPAIVERVDEIRTQLRVSRGSIRQARCNLNVETRAYRVLCDQLRAERRACIQSALVTFRQTRRSAYRKASSRVTSALAKVERVEKEELRKKITEDELAEYCEEINDYIPKEHMRCADLTAADPISDKFWKG